MVGVRRRVGLADRDGREQLGLGALVVALGSNAVHGAAEALDHLGERVARDRARLVGRLPRTGHRAYLAELVEDLGERAHVEEHGKVVVLDRARRRHRRVKDAGHGVARVALDQLLEHHQVREHLVLGLEARHVDVAHQRLDDVERRRLVLLGARGAQLDQERQRTQLVAAQVRTAKVREKVVQERERLRVLLARVRRAHAGQLALVENRANGREVRGRLLGVIRQRVL